MRSITSAPAGQGGDLSTEQSQTFDRLKAELEGVERSLARAEFLREAERRMEGQQLHSSGDDRLDQALQSFSLRKAICSQVPDLARQVDCGRELEVSSELARRAGRPFNGIAVPYQVFLEKRTITSGTVSPDFGGANLIATDLRGDQFIDRLRERLAVRALGARVLTGLVGNVDIPKLTASATAQWVADDEALVDADPTFGKVQLDIKHCGTLSEYSRSVLLQSSPSVEGLLRSDFAQTLARALDVGAIAGPGGDAPTGVINMDGHQTVAGPVSWSKVLELIQTLEDANAEGTGFVTTPGLKRVMRSTVRVDSTDSRMIMEEPNSLAGYPLFSTTNAPSTAGSPADEDALIFGDWRDLLIGFWSELDIIVNPFLTGAYQRGGVSIRAMMSVDIVARHVQSFVSLSDQV